MKYLILILFAFTLNAQTIWYIDRDATGSANGTSWTDAWNRFEQITWGSISAGDTIYVSGGTDSTTYKPALVNVGASITVVSYSPYYTFATPVIIARAWQSGHNGEVVITNGIEKQNRIFETFGISNIKFHGLKFYDSNTDRSGFCFYVGGTEIGTDIDSLIQFENCHWVTRGHMQGAYVLGYKNSFTNCVFESERNHYSHSQDFFGFSGGRGGHTLDGNLLIARNYFVPLSGNGTGATTTDTSLIVAGLGATFIAGVNDAPNFYADSKCYIACGDRNAIITRNNLDTFYVAQWLDAATGTPTTRPADGLGWGTDDEHYDMFQIGTIGQYANHPNENLATVFKNNIIVNNEPYGSNWTGFIYANYMGNSQRFYVYNNIFVFQEGNSSISPVWIADSAVNYDTECFILNNTIIIKGKPTSVPFTVSHHKRLVVKNNLVVIDTTIGKYYNQDPNGTAFVNLGGGTNEYWYQLVKEIDYNYYAEQGDVQDANFAFDSLTWTLSDWQSVLGRDTHSLFENSSTVTFTNKGDSLATGYYTTAGRDLGEDLSAEFPFLSTDILGNPRTGTWDIGALEYQDGAVDTVPSFSFTGLNNRELNTAYTGSATFSGADSTFHVWTTTGARFNINSSSGLNSTMKTAVNGDVVYVETVTGASYSTGYTETIVAGGVSRDFTVTTKAYVPPSGSRKILKGKTGKVSFDKNGRIIYIQ